MMPRHTDDSHCTPVPSPALRSGIVRVPLSTCLLIGLLCSLLSSACGFAQTPVPSATAPTTKAPAAQPIPPPPEIPVRSYILMDFHSGRTLAESNSTQPFEPASITKVMTAYVIYKALREGTIKLTDLVTISAQARQAIGSRMFVEVNHQVSVEDLLMGMVVQSGNDASIALAEHIAGSEATFAELMNRQAAELGLSQSHFVNATGLSDPNHHMSARDIALLSRALIKNFPNDYQRYSVRSFTYNNIEQPNRNRLLWRDESVDGIKTGFTNAAGYCLAASAKRGDTRLISVVLGAKSIKDRFDASQALLNYGFRFYETYKLYSANSPLAQARVWKGSVRDVALGVAEDLFITAPRGQTADIKPSFTVTQTILEAPVPQGKVVGQLTVQGGNETLTTVPLVTLQAVPEAGFLGRLIDQVMLTFHRWFN